MKKTHGTGLPDASENSYLFDSIKSIPSLSMPNALSPRCSKELLNAAKAMAFMARRHYVVPEDIQAVFAAVTDHRLNGVDGLKHSNQALSQTLLNSVDPLL